MQSAGDDLISVDVASTAMARALADALRDRGGWLEAVAGIDSVVVRYDSAVETRESAAARLQDARALSTAPHEQSVETIEIPVIYGGEHGPDLPLICEQLRLSAAEFIDLHTGAYTIDLLGFIPGFAYVGGLDKRLMVDRLAEPRAFVPAGSIGIAAGRSGIYSLPGPGGWPLIGRTEKKLFDASQTDPFTLKAGTTVIFSAVSL